MTAEILFYTADPKTFEREIHSTLSFAAHSSYQFQPLNCITKLKQILHDNASSNPIIILTAMSHEELKELYEIKLLFENLPIILIIADESEETLRRAHLLEPKFLTTIEHDYVCVLSVIEFLANLDDMTDQGDTADQAEYSSCTVKEYLPN